ncbi:GerAB/ArcD/ProY family transporter [Ammoniphilus resinae]|uniref:Spore germination protein (Amino acid permease) n=1 Tax=Ammoniphilus resinae TaxID=861532 RepID=A0ABS4GUU9_9BACL|nr:GerAB/ArcD/ProY family transporter [Ammoniphilus resinae]MBP1933912.1 spore germination protein (amino acid permease) [Ammoniphilus resinae]
MKQQQVKLGIREYVCIAFLMIGMKGTEDTPSMLFSHVQNAAWMVPLLSGGLFFIPFFLLLKTLSLFQDKNVFEVIQQLLGKYIAFFVSFIIFIMNSYAISLDTRTYTNIIRAYYFTTTPRLVLYGILMVVCVYAAKKGIQRIGSISYILIFYVALSFFIAFWLSLDDSQFASIFPIWGPGKLELLKAAPSGLGLWGEFFILTSLYSFMTSFKDFRNGTWIAFGCVVIQLSLATMLFIALFDKGLVVIGYPFHVAIRYISLGEFLPNIETLFFPIWLSAAFIRFAAFLFINALIFGHLFKIKEYQYLIPSLATIYLLIGMIPETPNDVAQLKEPLRYIAGPTFAAISIILWLTAWFKGEFKHAKNKNNM